ncbi:MAG: Coq4 family protein [Polyangiaceae bacterium]
MDSTNHSTSLRRAFRAARALAKNPDDLPQVFTIIESLSGGAMNRVQRRMEKSDTGRRLLETKPDIVELLADREALRKLPEGSLGRAYLDFVESENISADGIRAADKDGSAGEIAMPNGSEFVHARMRDTHDLWHAAVGYKGDVLGEIALLAFSLAQTKNLALALIIGVGLLKTRALPGSRAVIFDGFRRGRKAVFLPEQPWESLLALPVEEVRQRLSLEAPPVYTPLRTADLRASGAIA